LEDILPYGSAGLISRARNTIKQLNKQAAWANKKYIPVKAADTPSQEFTVTNVVRK
jgi:hypothetical protein